jgi:hypothetical protein
MSEVTAIQISEPIEANIDKGSCPRSRYGFYKPLNRQGEYSIGPL